MALFPRDNDALQVDPPGGQAHITTHASDWLWFVFAFMLLSWSTSWFWTFWVRPLFPLLLFSSVGPPPDAAGFSTSFPTVVLGVVTIAYLMASNLG